MRALRVVGLTEDGEVVLEDPVRLERFRVPADERLRAAARGDLSRLGQIAIELESQLRPREIQARIRAGASVEQVAAAAGVPEQKIERFAYPVLLERFRTAENAQRAHPLRADGPDNRTLAEVVGHTFGLRGQAYEGARWDSWKGEDGRWVVALSWRAGRSDNRAHWTFQPGAHGGTVTALDEHASDLVEGLPARPLRTVGAVVDMTRPEEEPPSGPSPVEQWRAAASDSYRDPGRPVAERGATRAAPEPWRPAPPVQRQAEPAVEPRGAYRGGEPRPAAEPRDGGYRTAAEWTGERGPATERSAPVVPSARTESAHPEPTRVREPDRVAVDVRAAGSAEAPRPAEGARAATGAAVQAGGTSAPATERPDRSAAVTTATTATPPVDPSPAGRPDRSAAVTTATTATPPVDPSPAGRPDRSAAVATATTAAPPVDPSPAERPGNPTDTGAGDTAPAEAGGPLSTPEPASDPAGDRADVGAVAGDTAPAEAAGTLSTPEPAGDLVGDRAGAAVAADGESATASAPEPAAPQTPSPQTPSPETPSPETPSPGTTAPEPAPTPSADSPAAGRRTKKGKPVMPSWDEVLLGVRGPR
jgi:Protein of unknown function (DUF3071)